MVEHEVRWQGLPARRNFDYVVTTLDDRDRIRDLLNQNRAYTAYALGQLEPGLFERTRWHFARGDTGSGLVLHSRGGLGDATFILGDGDAVAAILSIHPGPAHTYATCMPQHVQPMHRVYRLSSQLPMMRMAVTPESFRPHASDGAATPLNGSDIRKVNALYASDGGPSYYVPEHINAGVYRGIVVNGRLVAVAGTHVVSRREGVAVVGNVFTHTMHRGRGYGTAVTSAVTGTLLGYCDYVALTVDPKNGHAIQAYKNLGYQTVCHMVEASAVRRDPAGVVGFARRVRAAVRGRRYAGSFVSIPAR